MLRSSIAFVAVLFIGLVLFLSLREGISRRDGATQIVATAAQGLSEAAHTTAITTIEEELGLASMKVKRPGEAATEAVKSEGEIKDNAGTLLEGAKTVVAKGTEIRLPVTLRLVQEGSSWQLAGVELANLDTTQIQKLTAVGAAVASTSREGAPREATATQSGSAAISAARAVSAKRIAPVNLESKRQFAVYFLEHSSHVGPTGRATLQSIVEQAKQTPRATIALKGYADPAGSERVNAQLSKLRAEAVKKLLAEGGIAPTAIVVEPVAAQVVDGLTPSQRRRVEITLQ